MKTVDHHRMDEIAHDLLDLAVENGAPISVTYADGTMQIGTGGGRAWSTGSAEDEAGMDEALRRLQASGLLVPQTFGREHGNRFELHPVNRS